MKNILAAGIFLASIVISTTVGASDWTILGSIRPNETVNKQITLPEGQIVVDVEPTNKQNIITCRFLNNARLIVEQADTNHCIIKPLLMEALTVNVRITNLQKDKGIDYKIWVHAE
jgi:hypothetical protein